MGQMSRKRHTGAATSLAGSKGVRHSKPSNRIILCAGLKSSGSTWIYNAVIKIIEHGIARTRSTRKGTLLPFYAESIEQFPTNAVAAKTLVIKTHIPEPSLQFLAGFVPATTILSVREPRDAIVSLMQRFGHDFENCLQEVSRGACHLVQLSRLARPMILRYEDRFFDKRDTIGKLAARLGYRLPASDVSEIYYSLAPEQIDQYILKLERSGAFGQRVTPDSFDPRTHWHPGHIGDRKVGKFDEFLLAKMQQSILQSTREYCVMFGYPTLVQRRRIAPRR